jgi:ATP-dependent helicase/nuclease subunit B
VRGGTRVLADQAACPFRAFARHRLGARALESPEPGLDALQRGQLLHALMAELWKQLGTSAALAGDVGPAIERAAARAVDGIDERLAVLEKRRLARLARDWLEVERGRAPFEVVHVEDERSLGIGGLTLAGRIDRMDRLADGTHAILDYKTGNRVSANDWQGERPDDPQLPAYAIAASEEVTALAFAKLRAGDMKFSGFSLGKDVLPGVTEAKSWSGLQADWKAALEKLAAGFAAGEAQVDPKRALATCRHCDLQPLCRVHERFSALADEEGE